MLAEIRLTMFESEGFLLTLIKFTVDWNKDKTSIGMLDKHFVTANGQRGLRNNTIVQNLILIASD